jgi:hypothetical protein
MLVLRVSRPQLVHALEEPAEEAIAATTLPVG